LKGCYTYDQSEFLVEFQILIEYLVLGIDMRNILEYSLLEIVGRKERIV